MDSRQSSIGLLFAFILLVCFQTGSANKWNYGDLGPDVWPDLYPTCAGSAQTPVDIKQSCTVYRRFSPFRLSADYFKTLTFQLVNSGHGIAARLVNTNTTLVTVNGGGLGSIHKFVNFHFHWGQNYASGSEHYVNGKKYAAELHLVHQHVVTRKLAVLGFLIKSDRGENDGNDTVSNTWRRYFTAGSKLTEQGDTGVVNMNLGMLIRNHLTKFWRYQGSLTTPPCGEGVTWTVFADPIEINDENLAKFRSNVMKLNARDPQPLNNRKIERSFILNGTSNRCQACE